MKKIQKNEVLIPIIGEFSSGKSSFINSVLGKDLLPGNVTPTTAVVNESRFSSKEEFILKDYLSEINFILYGKNFGGDL